MMNETLNGEPLGVRWRAGCEWVHPSALSPMEKALECLRSASFCCVLALARTQGWS